MADHLVVIRDGHIVAAGEPRDVYDRPPDLDTGRFLGDAAVLPGDVTSDADGHSVECVLGRLAVDAWHGQLGPCQVLVRPEHLSAVRAGGPSDAGAAGTVTALSYRGSELRLSIALRTSRLRLAVSAPGTCRLGVGDSVLVSTDAAVCTYPI